MIPGFKTVSLLVTPAILILVTVFLIHPYIELSFNITVDSYTLTFCRSRLNDHYRSLVVMSSWLLHSTRTSHDSQDSKLSKNKTSNITLSGITNIPSQKSHRSQENLLEWTITRKLGLKRFVRTRRAFTRRRAKVRCDITI